MVFQLITLLVSCSEYPRDKPFQQTMVSYLKKIKYKREKKSRKPSQSYLLVLTGQA